MEDVYKNSVIYRIVCNDGYYYIGVTIQSLEKRLKNHKACSKNGTNKIYEHINEIGWDNVKIELIENFPCATKNELNEREEYYLKQHKKDELCLNHITTNIYKNGKVYRIQCIDGHFYIGSTTQKLNRRLNHHIQLSKKDSTNFYNHMKELGWENAHIELIEDYPCETSKELHQREDHYIKTNIDNPLCLNQKRAFLSEDGRVYEKNQYTEQHRQEANERTKEYRAAHHEEILEKEAAYREAHREELARKQREYIRENKEKIKESRANYLVEHKEQIAEYSKQYAEANREKIAAYKSVWQQKHKEETRAERETAREEKRNEREQKKQEYHQQQRAIHLCDCGGTYQLHHKKRHDNGKKHVDYLNSTKEST
jgi:predicted GIY-YIG superfamily endonuclease